VPSLVLSASGSDRVDPSPRVGASSQAEPAAATLRAEQVAAVWRLLRRLGVSNSEADDATQQVFLVVAERRAVIEPGKERSFVYGTALRVARAVQRPPSRQSVDLDEHETADEDAPRMEDLVDQHAARRVLDRLLEQMPFELRAVLVLFEIEELSTSEIALALEIPRGTAASRLRRAREDFEARVARLRARLIRHGEKP
jgi:RNA polymerase sigma-70 factor, ECF subfamily